jgi:hypothetical protein
MLEILLRRGKQHPSSALSQPTQQPAGTRTGRGADRQHRRVPHQYVQRLEVIAMQLQQQHPGEARKRAGRGSRGHRADRKPAPQKPPTEQCRRHGAKYPER